MKKYIGYYILIWAALNGVLSAVWPSIEAAASASRSSSPPGGELLLWLLSFAAVFAVDTVRKGRSSHET